jgi:hypothetical protein
MELNLAAPVSYAGSIVIGAPMHEVWRILVDIPNWPAWNPEVQQADLHGPLAAGTHFVWKSGGVKIVSRLAAVHAGHTLSTISWQGRTFGISAVHAYTLQASGEHTLVRTGESFEGWAARLFKNYLRLRLARAVDQNLLCLKDAAENPQAANA